MVMPVIGKNLVVSAYIQSEARVTCKVDRAAQTLALMLAELKLAALIRAARSFRSTVFSRGAFVTLGFAPRYHGGRGEDGTSGAQSEREFR